ncbi:MAG: tetratricopeptide repeat protein [Eubacteriales bacterium]|nr:tetratricopeptide repeat protein [Eubacteriales bacterium]
MQKKLEQFYRNLDARYGQGNLEQVERFLLQHVQKAQNNPEEMDELIAGYNELGSLYRGISRFAESIVMFQYAQELVCEKLGRNSMQYATVLNNMAGTYRLKGEYETAIRLFEESLDIYRQCGVENNETFASVLNNIALVYRETGQVSKAITYLEEALKLIAIIPECRQELAITYHNLAALYMAAEDREKAMDYVNRAMFVFEQCAEEENVHYAAGLNSLAAFLYAQGDNDTALRLYQKSARYTKRFFGENLEYGVTFRNMYWVYEKLGKRKEAIQSLEKAKQIFEKLLGAEHERTCAISDDLKRLKEVRQV